MSTQSTSCVSALYTVKLIPYIVRCFGLELLKGLILNITKSCKEIDDKIEICVETATVKDSNRIIICCEFLAVK